MMKLLGELCLKKENALDKYPYGVYNVSIRARCRKDGDVTMQEPKAMDCCHKFKERETDELKSLIHRLNRIEGQIRGIRKMLENNAYCIDILGQVSAARSALDGFSKELLSNHIKTCVVNDIQQGKDDTVDELIAVLHKLMK